jgi:hypothetical protein
MSIGGIGANNAHVGLIGVGAFFLFHAIFPFSVPVRRRARGVPTKRGRINAALIGVGLIAAGALLWYINASTQL